MNHLEFSGESLDLALFATSFLLVLSVISSRISGVLGLPALLMFLGIGMISGSDGPGGIVFTNYSLTFAVGSVTLAFILFDGGFRTSWSNVRPVLGVGISLSSFGVIVTAASTAVFCHFVLELSWLTGILLGTIVSSTDAAAVFSVLRSQNIGLKGKVQQILEFEAGSNDPVSIFFTIAALSYAINPQIEWFSFVVLFLKQAGFGLLLGGCGGFIIRWIINNLRLEYEGLYSVLMVGFVVLLFSTTSHLGGSGFLSVYVAGIILGNSKLIHKGSILRFYDGIAWISQITLFLILGLLVFPSRLASVWKEGLLLALFLSFIARPLCILVSIPTRQFNFKERFFISWVGLRGAAPIVLATLPWSAHFPQAEYLFHLVFFVVLFSILFQGISIPWVAKHLHVTQPLPVEERESAKLGVLPPGFVSLRITVKEDASAAGKKIVALNLPNNVLFTTMERSGRFVVPRGDSILEHGDRITGFAKENSIKELNEIFGNQSVQRA